MIRIELDEQTLARTRIAISPLAELTVGLFLLRRPADEVPWPYGPWAARARQVLRTNPATAPVHVYLQFDDAAPDLFAPVPTGSIPTITEQLDRLRATPAEVVEEQFAKHYPGGEPVSLRPFRTNRHAAFGRLADGLAAYWDAAIAPYWPAMRAALEEEVLLRSRVLAADGPGAVLSQLHELIRWEPPVLTLMKSTEHRLRVVDQRLLLVPLIFSRGTLMCSSDHPDVFMVTYQSRGAAVLADGPARPAPADHDPLAILLGRGRAAVLRALTVPVTTTGLAATLGLAPSTVSQHLAALQEAGVVRRRRVGRRVLYGLEPAGRALLGLLDANITEFVS
ncbi:ArsR/SmtB family transcription factor [Krasilnikovia sp. MM14-A1259]|uniref:ArsR/SmtB family transcription factor n=1 Tax=Krasilnikovia sp. MM14-A1259 TaxID=3373539 RepID=UPI0038117041